MKGLLFQDNDLHASKKRLFNHLNSGSIHWIALAVCIALLVTAIPSVYTLDNGDSSLEAAEDLPSVFLAILARNSAHMLPNFLGYL